MRTALILDHDRLAQERGMFNRLCVALVAEGIHPVRVVPSDFDRSLEDQEERRIALLPRLPFSPGPLPWTRRPRAMRLADELDRLGVQLVHAAGQSFWSTAVTVADELERPLVIGVWSLREAMAARKHRNSPVVSAWLAPSERIGAALRAQVNAHLVHVVPAGVPVAAMPPRSVTRTAGIAGVAGHAADSGAADRFLVALGDGRNLRAWEVFLMAFRRVVESPACSDVRLVVEVRGPRGHDIWRKARDLELLHRVSSISDAAQHRPLLLRTDAICLPESMDAMRTIVLEGMAVGVPVAACDAPAMDGFDAGSGIELVTEPKVETWTATLQRILDDRLGVDAVCRAAWQHVHRHHRSTAQAAGIASLYLGLVHGDALPFDPTTRTAPKPPA